MTTVLVRIFVDRSIVQQHGVEALNRNRYMLKMSITPREYHHVIPSLTSRETLRSQRPSWTRKFTVDTLKTPRCDWLFRQYTNLPAIQQLSHPTVPHPALSACHWISVRPSGRFPSCLPSPEGSLKAGMPADLKTRQKMSFNTWCLAVLPDAFLQTVAVNPWHQQGCYTDICADTQAETETQATLLLRLTAGHNWRRVFIIIFSAVVCGQTIQG